MNERDQRRIDAICTRSNGIQPLRQVSAIPPGYQKNRSQIWRLTTKRAALWDSLGLIDFDHRPGYGTFGRGSTRTKSYVMATDLGREWVKLCEAACRQSNLSWQDSPYGWQQTASGEMVGDSGYVTWQAEWIERREAFRRALTSIIEEFSKP